jgi:hypothetical protein
MLRRAALLAMLGSACGRSELHGFGFDAGAADGFEGGFDDDGDGPGHGHQSCEEVDFLFVVDNSGSMADNQANLVAHYDAFVGGFAETIERLESIHVGVVATDAYAHNTSSCQALGGLVVQTGGTSSSDRRCGPYVGLHNYMSEDDDLDETFRCAARVGTDGSGAEQSLGAAIAAMSPPLVDAGQCNEGFIRPNALLVLVVVTDEDAEMDPLFAAQAIVDAKRGSFDDVVVVLLANTPDSDCALGNGGKIAYGLTSFAASFRHAFVGPICADDYSDVFHDAVAQLESACPQG